MKITPSNGKIIVSQGNTDFKKNYQETFPDSKEGMKAAVDWANTIALGWHQIQDKDWEKHHAA